MGGINARFRRRVIHSFPDRKGSDTHSILNKGAREASREHKINASHSPNPLERTKPLKPYLLPVSGGWRQGQQVHYRLVRSGNWESHFPGRIQHSRFDEEERFLSLPNG